MLIQNFFSAVSYGVLDPESAKEKARLKQQEENRRLGFPDRPVHGLPPRIPVGLDLVDSNDARCVWLASWHPCQLGLVNVHDASCAVPLEVQVPLSMESVSFFA